MINSWWLALEGFVSLGLLIWVRNMAYRHGVWDGAFNHFLPIVRREMLFYDAHRARAIFEAEESHD